MRLATFTIPFTAGLSKNSGLKASRRGFMYRSRESKGLIDMVSLACRSVCGEVPWPKQKTWVSIFITKPTMRGDAINYVDNICDGVKRAIGVDDNWFSLSVVDWEVDKANTKIQIVVSQEELS